MNPKLWGNGAWFSIFIIIFELFDDIEKMKRLLYLICKSLPCLKCRNNILEAIKNNNIMSETNSMNIVRFFIQLRNKYQTQLIIPENEFKDNVLTKRKKAFIIKNFILEFTNLNNDEKLELYKIKNEIEKLTQ